jgi:hypothetical protein
LGKEKEKKRKEILLCGMRAGEVNKGYKGFLVDCCCLEDVGLVLQEVCTRRITELDVSCSVDEKNGFRDVAEQSCENAAGHVRAVLKDESREQKEQGEPNTGQKLELKPTELRKEFRILGFAGISALFLLLSIKSNSAKIHKIFLFRLLTRFAHKDQHFSGRVRMFFFFELS